MDNHEHTSTPPLGSPWCEVCDAMLTWAILADEALENIQRRKEEPDALTP